MLRLRSLQSNWECWVCDLWKDTLGWFFLKVSMTESNVRGPRYVYWLNLTYNWTTQSWL